MNETRAMKVPFAMNVIEESIYDHPKYYDLVFNADVAAETKFILGSAAKYLDSPVQSLFEPACGTGRLVAALQSKGVRTFGLDLNPKAVVFCNDRLRRRGLVESAIVADMCDFSLDDFQRVASMKPWLKKGKVAPACVAFNTINSFRHVGSEAAARDHLRCMALAVRPGGLYLLGVHLTPTTELPSETESWSARRGHLSINTHMWTVDRNTKTRLERFGIRFDVHTPSGSFRINDELRLRSYTPKQMNNLIAHGGQWETIATYDFGYDLKHPIQVDSGTEDVVYVLKRV